LKERGRNSPFFLHIKFNSLIFVSKSKNNNMKLLNFVMVAKHLTGDSEVHFFPTNEEADAFFDGLVKPLLDVCMKNDLEEDEAYSFGQTKDMSSTLLYNVVRFDSGYDSELDALLDECNHCYRMDSIEVPENVTHYVADFSEWVDESVIEFYTEQEAKEVWNDKIDEEIRLASKYHGIEISRHHQETWDDKSGVNLFQETHYSDIYSDAYFGHSDMTWTFRIGIIN